jgi:ABC-type transporter Mla subunit MlaD
MPVSPDPDELDRAAVALGRIRDQYVATVRSLRGVPGLVPQFRGQDGDRFRQTVEALARTTQQHADEATQRAQSLRKLAQQIRSLPRVT